MKMKQIMTLLLCACLLFGLWAAMPAVSADGLDDYDLQMWTEQYGCVVVSGGEIRTSQLQSGTSYFFDGSVQLILDADFDCTAICSKGSIDISGKQKLTAEIIYAYQGLSVSSGTVVCPEMDNPPEAETTVHNGLTGLRGVCISGGSVTCPIISSGPETVRISGGKVKTGSISALFGYSQSGGQVEADYIWAREGLSATGGSLTVSRVGTWVYHIIFPMVIAEPVGARYQCDDELRGYFVDASGKRVEKVRYEKANYDPKPFTDVKAKAYYSTPVAWAVWAGVTTGTDKTHFTPDRVCTRAQAVTFLWRSCGRPEPKSLSHPFTDVASGSFYEKAVCWATENGITRGVTAEEFRPDASCTRGQIVTFLWRMTGTPEPAGRFPEEELDHMFEDVSLSDYFGRAAVWAKTAGITTGTDEYHFAPMQSCTRAQIVTFLFRLMNP